MGKGKQMAAEIKIGAMRQNAAGKSIKALSQELGISPHTLYGWRNAYRKRGADAFIGCGHSYAAADEVAQLRAENAALREKIAGR
ncbi:MAG: transposase [Oscillospiraceae bacterium]|jgi:transposase-like protein|nr:transposase [Oscillospiraceae bacterium]